jgi:tetratricopeptide (TPR) repeat protein
MISTGVISCTSQSLVRQGDVRQQVLLQHEGENVAGQTGYTEISTKDKATTINTKSKYAVNKATGKEDDVKIQKPVDHSRKSRPVIFDYTNTVGIDPAYEEYTTVNLIEKLIEKTGTPVELEEAEEESEKEHIYNLPAGQQDKNDLRQVGLAHFNLGIAYAERDLIDQATLEFQRAIIANPHHLESHVQLGTAYGLKGMTNEALSEFKKAIDINLNEAVTKIVFNALPVAVNQKVKTDVVKARINLGNAYKEEGKLRRSQLEYEKALELEPEHPIARKSLSEIYYSLGTSFLENKKYDNAIDAFNKVLELSPDFPQIKDVLEEAHYNLGINYAKNGELNKAIVEFNKTMEINLNYAMLDKNNLNIISKDKKAVSGKHIHHDINRPGENVNNSTNGDKREDSSHVEEKEGGSSRKQIPREIDVVEEMILAEKGNAKESEHEEVQLKTGISNEDQGKKQIKEKIVAMQAKSPVAEEDDNILANTYIVPGEIESASGHRFFSYYVTRNYNSKIGFNEAIKKYEDAIRKNPYGNNAHHNLAYAYYSKALHLDDAIARREDSPEGNQSFTVKRFYIHDIVDDKEIDKISLAKHTETFGEKSVALYNRSGYTHFKKGMFNDAIFEYRNALKIDPKYSKTLYNLAFSFLIKGSHLDIALRDNKKY